MNYGAVTLNSNVIMGLYAMLSHHTADYIVQNLDEHLQSLTVKQFIIRYDTIMLRTPEKDWEWLDAAASGLSQIVNHPRCRPSLQHVADSEFTSKLQRTLCSLTLVYAIQPRLVYSKKVHYMI